MSQGSLTSMPPSYGSAGIPARSMRASTSASACGVSKTIVQWRRPTVCRGAAGTPMPRQTFTATWWW